MFQAGILFYCRFFFFVIFLGKERRKKGKWCIIIHPISPVFDEHSEIPILGSFSPENPGKKGSLSRGHAEGEQPVRICLACLTGIMYTYHYRLYTKYKVGLSMNCIRGFFTQEVPRAGKEIPSYYRRAMAFSEALLEVYFLVCFFLFPLINGGRWEWIPLAFMGFCGLSLWTVYHRGVRLNLLMYGILCMGWVGWNVYQFGWSTGAQHFMTLMVVFVFFNVYDRALIKLLWLMLTLAARVMLFSWSQRHAPVYVMDLQANTIYQAVNTFTFFLMLALTCVFFSTNIQNVERQLLIRNQELHKEAGTDPLTGLPNRRAMIEKIPPVRLSLHQ